MPFTSLDSWVMSFFIGAVLIASMQACFLLPPWSEFATILPIFCVSNFDSEDGKRLKIMFYVMVCWTVCT
jgi:hypothetical protein